MTNEDRQNLFTQAFNEEMKNIKDMDLAGLMARLVDLEMEILATKVELKAVDYTIRCRHGL